MQPPSPAKHAAVSSGTPSPSPSPLAHAPTTTQSTSTSSHASQVNMYQPQPLREAVSMAFDENLDVSQQISPELIKHITEQVISNLKLNGLAAAAAAADQRNVPHKQQSAPAAPSLAGSSSPLPPRNVYTPPSPNREQLSNISSIQNDMQDSQTDGPGEKMTAERLASVTEDTRSSTMQPSHSASSSPTTLEKIWGPLFDDGKPTARLGQFLRGLALHIIEDFEPKNSLVITPQKMLRFYDKVRLTDEVYPWSDMFGGKMTNSSISHLYRDLSCQHHFVQRQFDEKPNIPALTPLGFQCWMTHVIQAHPEEEFMRFAKASMEMPVSNADDRRERFPKQLSRRLFPKQSNHSVRDLFQDSVLADPAIELPRHTGTLNQSQSSHLSSDQPAASAPSKPQMPATSSQSSQLSPKMSHNEREHVSTSNSTSAPFPVDHGQSQPIERERKPYSVAPSSRKMYDGEDLSRTSFRPQRANSMKNATRPAPPTDDELRSRPSRARTGSQSGARPNFGKPRSLRSPSVHGQPNPYPRPEGEIPPWTYNNTTSRASHIHDDSENEHESSYSRDTWDEANKRRIPDDMSRPYQTQSYPTQPKPIFDPPQYQRQQYQDSSNGYGPAYNGNPYPPPRYG